MIMKVMKWWFVSLTSPKTQNHLCISDRSCIPLYQTTCTIQSASHNHPCPSPTHPSLLDNTCAAVSVVSFMLLTVLIAGCPHLSKSSFKSTKSVLRKETKSMFTLGANPLSYTVLCPKLDMCPMFFKTTSILAVNKFHLTFTSLK